MTHRVLLYVESALILALTAAIYAAYLQSGIGARTALQLSAGLLTLLSIVLYELVKHVPGAGWLVVVGAVMGGVEYLGGWLA